MRWRRDGLRKRMIEAVMNCLTHITSMLLRFLIAFASFAQAISATAEQKAAATQTDHQNVTHYLRPDGIGAKVRTAEDWQMRRRQIIAGMEEAMGPMPHPRSPVPLDIHIVEEHRENGVIRRKVKYHTDGTDQWVNAWLLLPKNRGKQRRPAVLCLHQTTTNGKDSPVGLSDRPTLHYAIELARRGYVTLSPDYPSFGEYNYDFDSDEYHSGSMKAIYDNTRAIDVLQSLSEVDGQRIGCIGHSLGGHNGLFTAVFDERIQAVVTSCGFTSFHKYMGGDLTGWSGPRYMPRIATRYELSADRMPFDFAELLASIAPRGVFVVAPLNDNNFDVTGVRDVVASARPIYKLLGKPDNLQVVYPNANHDFPNNEREEAYKFLDKLLGHRLK